MPSISNVLLRRRCCRPAPYGLRDTKAHMITHAPLSVFSKCRAAKDADMNSLGFPDRFILSTTGQM